MASSRSCLAIRDIKRFFTPIAMSASGLIGPLMIAFLQGAYERAKAAGKFEMRQQSELHYSWNTMVASSFWGFFLHPLLRGPPPVLWS